MKIIGVCGKIGSGKDTVADYLAENHGYHKIVMSDIIRLELETLGRPVNREEMQKLTKEYKAVHGKGIWAEKTIETAKRRELGKVVVTGIRDSREVEIFRERSDFTLINVEADEDVRLSRLAKRGSAKDVVAREEFSLQEEKEAEIYDMYKRFGEFSDITIQNNGTIEELGEKIEKLVQEKKL